MNADGSGQANLTNSPASHEVLPTWAPDGTRIAFVTTRDGNDEVYVMNGDGSGQANLTNHGADDSHPAWSPDGRKIVFSTSRDLNTEIYVMNADGSGQANLTLHAAEDSLPDWETTDPVAKTVTLRARPRVVEKGDRTRLKATVSPCSGHEGDMVEFYRKQKLLKATPTNEACVARLKVRVKRATKFRAVSPKQDLDHLAGTSKRVKVRVEEGSPG